MSHILNITFRWFHEEVNHLPGNQSAFIEYLSWENTAISWVITWDPVIYNTHHKEGRTDNAKHLVTNDTCHLTQRSVMASTLKYMYHLCVPYTLKDCIWPHWRSVSIFTCGYSLLLEILHFPANFPSLVWSPPKRERAILESGDQTPVLVHDHSWQLPRFSEPSFLLWIICEWR